MKKIGIIGCGNMGGAMLRQMLKGGLFAPEEICVADKNEALRQKIHAEYGVVTTADNAQAAGLPAVLLAVKPQFIQDVGAEISAALHKDALVISIVAGCEIRMLKALLKNEDAAIVRVMPNTPAMVGEGVLAACRSEQVTDAQWSMALRLLSCMGLAEEVPESLMDAVTGVSGSSPAFAFLFLEALADAGVRGGLPRATAQRFAAQVLVGCGRLALETGLHPGQLKDMVTSPAGTTIEGVAALERDGFRYAVLDAVNAAIQKSKSFHS